jgi:hypothetical protein
MHTIMFVVIYSPGKNIPMIRRSAYTKAVRGNVPLEPTSEEEKKREGGLVI